MLVLNRDDSIGDTEQFGSLAFYSSVDIVQQQKAHLWES